MHAYTSIHTSTHTYVHTYIHTYIQPYIHVYMRVCMYTCTDTMFTNQNEDGSRVVLPDSVDQRIAIANQLMTPQSSNYTGNNNKKVCMHDRLSFIT